MTKPNRHHHDQAKRLSTTIAALAKLDTSEPRLAALLATADECHGAGAWGAGSTEVAVTTSGKSDPTPRAALTTTAPDPLASLVGDLEVLERLALRCLNGWGAVEQLAVPDAACECGRTMRIGQRLRDGLCSACYSRRKRATSATTP